MAKAGAMAAPQEAPPRGVRSAWVSWFLFWSQDGSAKKIEKTRRWKKNMEKTCVHVFKLKNKDGVEGVEVTI